VHSDAEVHDTADSELSFVPFGLEACSFVHFFPFQASANVKVSTPYAYSPTAMHALAEIHETPDRLLDFAL
jgi:hypothetical protein